MTKSMAASCAQQRDAELLLYQVATGEEKARDLFPSQERSMVAVKFTSSIADNATNFVAVSSHVGNTDSCCDKSLD